uniref:Chitin-binding type-2 domain-containing protein n=1 Tax=Steinernema glaseri TaxID=37863 RepID=A0A1I7YJV0_9BILA
MHGALLNHIKHFVDALKRAPESSGGPHHKTMFPVIVLLLLAASVSSRPDSYDPIDDCDVTTNKAFCEEYKRRMYGETTTPEPEYKPTDGYPRDYDYRQTPEADPHRHGHSTPSPPDYPDFDPRYGSSTPDWDSATASTHKPPASEPYWTESPPRGHDDEGSTAASPGSSHDDHYHAYIPNQKLLQCLRGFQASVDKSECYKKHGTEVKFDTDHEYNVCLSRKIFEPVMCKQGFFYRKCLNRPSKSGGNQEQMCRYEVCYENYGRADDERCDQLIANFREMRAN